MARRLLRRRRPLHRETNVVIRVERLESRELLSVSSAADAAASRYYVAFAGLVGCVKTNLNGYKLAAFVQDSPTGDAERIDIDTNLDHAFGRVWGARMSSDGRYAFHCYRGAALAFFDGLLLLRQMLDFPGDPLIPGAGRRQGFACRTPIPGGISEEIRWRQRMATAEAQEKYKQRDKCEWVDAQCHLRGLQQFTVRGLKKVSEVIHWYVLVHNLFQWEALRVEPVLTRQKLGNKGGSPREDGKAGKGDGHLDLADE